MDKGDSLDYLICFIFFYFEIFISFVLSLLIIFIVNIFNKLQDRFWDLSYILFRIFTYFFFIGGIIYIIYLFCIL